jgi:ABC-type transport system involved in cytochrome c biogenesis permease subunit
MRHKFLLLLALLLAAPAGAFAADAVDVTPLRTLPVLDHGRVKPIDTLARESVRFITGKEYFGMLKLNVNGEQEIAAPLDPLALALDWAAYPVIWQTQPVLYVPLLSLRAKLHMKETEKWISARAVMQNTDFTAWVQGLEVERNTAAQNEETYIPSSPAEGRLEDAAIELDNRLKVFESCTDMTIYCVLPSDGPKSTAWMPLPSVLTLPGADGETVKPIVAAWNSLLGAWKTSDNVLFASATTDLAQSIHFVVGGDYSDSARLDREVFYNEIRPFTWTWVLYFVAVIALIAALMSQRKAVYAGAMSLFCLAIAFHGAAFGLRCSITGWAPVTNMYETVIWVAVMAAVFSLVLELIYRRRIIAIGGATVAMLATIVASVMPPEMGNSIRNLTPVLRSNYWLSIHVLTIVSSYAAFALALVLGNIVLGQFIHGRVQKATIATNLLFTYRAVQVGVLLVAAGTILGGMWADVSWGRFWGWDPKEVWALIVLLTYLALLHGRFAGWIKQFGMAAGAVLCFTAVLMSWYGVNFVLGAGLHSYGFETGGQIPVAIFVLCQWAYVAFAWVMYRRHQGDLPPDDGRPAPGAIPSSLSPVTGK